MLLYGDLTYKIRGAIFEVYNYWGPGLFEQVYEESLVHQLHKVGLKVEQQVPLPVIYDGVKLPCDYRLDLLVEDKVIIELKSVEELHPVHYKQLMTYLKIAHKKVGLLVNFNVDDMAKGIHRLVL
jgi:GxxExxY protein